MMQIVFFLMLMMLQFGEFHVPGLKKNKVLGSCYPTPEPCWPASAHMAQSWTTGNA